MLSTKLKEAAGNSADATLYVDDVFSTYLYTGNNVDGRLIQNDIDLLTKGGMVWIKARSSAQYHTVADTNRGMTNTPQLATNTTDPASGYYISSYANNGFSVYGGAYGPGANATGITYASWTFRKAAKFFDVVTYTGTGSARTIAHSLGVAPGMVIVKRTDTTGNWQVYSNGLTSAAYSIQLNLTNAQASAPTVWNSTAPTSSVFSVGTDATVNASGGTYVAYLFAHDTSSTGIIQCGSYVPDGSGLATINLGWEPQYLLFKTSTGGGDWVDVDTMRGFSYSNLARLFPNTSAAENPLAGSYLVPTATGFKDNGLFGGSPTVIYMAIRMPNKPPTTGAQVFGLNARTGTGANATVTGGQTDDAVLIKNRGSAVADLFSSRLTGTGYLVTSSTAAEVAAGTTILQANPWDVMDGVKVGTTSTITNASANTFINYLFKRAPGFFDVVCYTGTGVATTQAHNLGVVPELMIVKRRNQASYWVVYHKDLGANNFIELNGTGGYQTDSTVFGTTPTSSVFYIGTNAQTNQSGGTPVAYLFATLAGISKVGSYTGNGTSQNIECGFATGARFFLVKATSTTGSWWVWDSARGITAGNDPALQLNSTAAEITTADAVDPYSPGITVNQEATCSINANGVSYIFLAVA